MIKEDWLKGFCEADCVILANGKFPDAEQPLQVLRSARVVVCCDGAVANLIAFGMEPTAIVGDLDSFPSELKDRFADRLYHFPDQYSNDLTKAVLWCKERGYGNIAILGATGLREDHTLGNIGLLSRYDELGVSVQAFTDHGILSVTHKTKQFASYKGQQVSFFSTNPTTRVTTHNLLYPLEKSPLPELWMGTLNESLGHWFKLELDDGWLVVFQTY